MAFIICTHKRSRPKISPSVCKKCSRIKTCHDYKDFVDPPLFPDLSNDVIKTWTIPRKKHVITEPKEIADAQVQLTFNCISVDGSKKD
jgi:hypothetical protein